MTQSKSRLQNTILIIGILLVAINLRPSITAVGPLAERLFESGLIRQEIGALTTVPLILFGVAGLWAGWIGSRIGFARALGMGLIVLAAGCWMRSFDAGSSGSWRMFGTMLIGAGIAMGNVLLPGVVKSRFPEHVGPMTSLYSTALNLGAALGIALAVPLANALAGGWAASLAAWGWVALFSLLIWSPEMLKKPTRRAPTHPLAGIRSLSGQMRAWELTAYMGLQSMVFYCTVAWLPTLLQYRGMEETVAANWVTAMQILGCGASLILPTLAGRHASQSWWIFGSVMTSALSILGILMLPAAWTWVAILILGLGLNASFGLCLLIIAMRSHDPETTGHLSSMAQAGGYVLAAPGPWLIGWISTLSGGWNLAFATIIAIAVLAAILGYRAGRPGTLRAIS